MTLFPMLYGLLLVVRLTSSHSPKKSLPHTVSVEKVSPVRVVIREVNTNSDNMLSDTHERQLFHLMHQPALYASKSVSEWSQNSPQLYGLGAFTLDAGGHLDELIGTLLVSRTLPSNRPPEMAGMLYLHSLAIDPNYQGIGLAKHLFSEGGIQWMKAHCALNGLHTGILLTVDYFNSKAIGLYLRAGFVFWGTKGMLSP